MFRQPAGTGSSQAFCFVAQNEAKPELAPAFLPISLAAPPTVKTPPPTAASRKSLRTGGAQERRNYK
jgi:hypothetical protein